MEKRVLLAVFLSLLVLYTYQALFVKPAPRPSPQSPPPAAQKTPTARPEAPEAPIGPGASGLGPEAAGQAVGPRGSGLGPETPETKPVVGADSERDVIVETDVVRAVFSNRGGVLKSWRLKHFLDDRGQPLELVPSEPLGVRPFTLEFDDPSLTRRLENALFAVAPPSADPRSEPVSIVFTFEDAAGLNVRKTFTLEPRSYELRFRAAVSESGRTLHPFVAWGPAIGDRRAPPGQYVRQPGAVIFIDGDVERLGPGDLAERRAFDGDYKFAGVEDHYFLTAVLSPGRARIEYSPLPLPAPPGSNQAPAPLVAYRVKPAGSPPEVAARVFAGPKDFDVLAALDRDLVRVIDYGIFAWLVVPLLRSLKWINGYVNNYGWSIIILTVLINAAMFPLRHKSVVSMRKMQEIQPEVKALQDRYAHLKMSDPARQKLNTELMNLYRERGVNPASGCVPMLLTMPVLFAFYSLLSVSIELRGAPFVGWIRDLSVHDPLYITPILMGITMVIQQKMTPSTADPVQQKMFMIMPLVFTAMSLWFPSGLVLYWLVSNVWAIGQQWLTNRIIGPPAVRAARPPAERRLKRVAGAREKQN